MSELLSHDVRSLIGKAVGCENLQKCSVIIHSGNKPGDGKMGDLIFVSVTEPQSRQQFDLVVKQNVADVSLVPLYRTEIKFYAEIIPILREFEKEYKVSTALDIFPMYYISDNFIAGKEMLVLENLKMKNFVMLDKGKTFDRKHLETVFKTYAKFHATTCAFSETNRDKFDDLTSSMEEGLRSSFRGDEINDTISTNAIDSILQMAGPDMSRKDVEKLRKYMGNLSNLWNLQLRYLVLLHGDCWSNNMMFKYDLSRAAVPPCDISYCFYANTSKEELDNLEHYLKFYYNCFKQRLTEFGMDADKIYPYEELIEDFEKFSLSGILPSFAIWRERFTDEKGILDHVGFMSKVNELFRHILDGKYIKFVDDDDDKEAKLQNGICGLIKGL